VARRVEAAGRRVVACEGAWIRSLLVLLLGEILFLPVPGALPVPRLPGPLDLGTPAFAARRARAVFALLEAVDRGEAPHRIRAAGARWEGVLVRGYSRPDPEGLAATAEALGPAGVRALVTPLLQRGFRAAAGLPDLIVLGGPSVRLDAHPSRLPPGPRFVEVKGPGDTLREGQRVWIDRLLRAGLPVEVWRVQEATG